MYKNFECVIHPEVTLWGWQHVQIQELTDIPKRTFVAVPYTRTPAKLFITCGDLFVCTLVERLCICAPVICNWMSDQSINQCFMSVHVKVILDNNNKQNKTHTHTTTTTKIFFYIILAYPQDYEQFNNRIDNISIIQNISYVVESIKVISIFLK